MIQLHPTEFGGLEISAIGCSGYTGSVQLNLELFADLIDCIYWKSPVEILDDLIVLTYKALTESDKVKDDALLQEIEEVLYNYYKCLLNRRTRKQPSKWRKFLRWIF